MNWSAVSAVAELIAAIGVMATLVYLAIQVRGSTRVVSAQSRHALSDFVLRIAIFRAENADRLAKLESGADLTAGDRLFQYWSHVQLILHAETYFHHHELGLMPDGHWRGYVRYITAYMQSPGFTDVWQEVGPGFSEDFVRWVETQLSGLRANPGSRMNQKPPAPAR